MVKGFKRGSERNPKGQTKGEKLMKTTILRTQDRNMTHSVHIKQIYNYEQGGPNLKNREVTQVVRNG